MFLFFRKHGKQNSGDIIANKKTFLLLKALEVADSPAREELSRWISLPDFNAEEKINAVKNIYTALLISILFSFLKCNAQNHSSLISEYRHVSGKHVIKVNYEYDRFAKIR